MGCDGLLYTATRNQAFQSTLPQGERRQRARSPPGPWKISIHAPTRGATIQVSKSPISFQFQSTLPQGERHVSPSLNLADFQNFNPRSHKGSDFSSKITSPSIVNFNPRSHKGSDAVGVYRFTSITTISIHAPTRGATDKTQKKADKTEFQSTLPQGERPGPGYCIHPGFRFQSTLPQGERLI